MKFSENRAIYEIMRKYGRARQATDDDVTGHMRFAYWINKATNLHSKYVIRIVLHGNSDYAKVPQC